ncbi:hypothetical protein B0T26DRAFT_492601 [Lasiosphaeria miniovina]|uniref:Uncharacterized protein n=1 Tax=Lasiosphaeria miniovina TaxID=1954250 RepID=A0AA40DHE8_9PEZI|nr:uncharacterized protein B0T26DRAFT_492601 [Lasiosphaeria miniovina]KAK0703220.1 hypothetical protein B0T26DRAFT_492601 [Lasiosphaeria miniovina]
MEPPFYFTLPVLANFKNRAISCCSLTITKLCHRAGTAGNSHRHAGKRQQRQPDCFPFRSPLYLSSLVLTIHQNQHHNTLYLSWAIPRWSTILLYSFFHHLQKCATGLSQQATATSTAGKTQRPSGLFGSSTEWAFISFFSLDHFLEYYTLSVAQFQKSNHHSPLSVLTFTKTCYRAGTAQATGISTAGKSQRLSGLEHHLLPFHPTPGCMLLQYIEGTVEKLTRPPQGKNTRSGL